MGLRVLLWLIEAIGGAALRGWVERLFRRDTSAGAHDATVAEVTHATAQARGDEQLVKVQERRDETDRKVDADGVAAARDELRDEWTAKD